MNKKYTIIMLGIVLITISSCTNNINDFSEYLHYLSENDNGLIKEKSVNGLSIKVKYLPIDYLSYQEFVNDNNESLSIKDIKKTYENSITFMMTIGPDKEQEFDITKVGVTNYKEYAQRIESMNFWMKENVSLVIGDKVIPADIAQMESIYGLENDRKILFVFQSKDSEGLSVFKDDITFTYKDDIFYTGTNKFKFYLEDINSIPKLEL